MAQETPEIHVVPADRVSLAQRVALMNAAYADYFVPIRVTQEQMSLMDTYYDVDQKRSVVARTRWESVGMALLALRGERAWVSGVGVAPSWRRRGVARMMMTDLIEIARSAGAHVMLLEVISQNAAARRLYASLGFRETRELLSWQRPAEADPLPLPAERLVPSDPAALLQYSAAWHDQCPCWQREPETLRHMASRLRGYTLLWKGEPAGYCLVASGDENISLIDVAVNPDAGLLMPGRILLQALAGAFWGRAISIMNVPADDSLNRILAALGFLVTLRQYEMALDL